MNCKYGSNMLWWWSNILALCTLYYRVGYSQDLSKKWKKQDEFRPSSSSDSDILPTIHPNSVLPYHPLDPEYEDYTYDEELEHVTQPFVPSQHIGNVFEYSKTTPQPPPTSPAVPKWKTTSKNIPKFILEPQNAYIIRGQPATLKCKVIHADKAYFTCNGEAMAASEMHKEVDSIEINEAEGIEAVTVKTLSLQLDRINIEEFFGLYSCRCDAWSAKGMTSSKNASIEVAFLRKEFEVPPYSQSVELGSQIQLRCHPPKGIPNPRIYWLKDRVEVQPERDSNYIQAADGHLIIIQAREKDRANYTCVAENVANRRLSPPARLNVHVSGGWSTWSEWSDCSSNCGQGFQRRDRKCDNPIPRWGGPICEENHVERTKCSTPCPDGIQPRKIMEEGEALDGGWSTWSPWSACNQDCVHHRRRNCNNPEPLSGGAFCNGLDHGVSTCTGDLCQGKRQILNSNPADEAQEMVEKDFSLLIGLSVALTVFLVVSLTSIRILRRKGRSPSMYTMTNLNYRRTEFADKSYKNNTSSTGDHQATESLLEINTNLNKISTRTPEPLTPKLMHYDSAMPSPFIDKKLAINTPQLKPRAISPHSEEHQYDIPFGHLNKSSNQRIISDHQRMNTGTSEHYDDLELSRQRLQQQQQRKSRTSNRTSSSTSHSSSRWPKSHEGSLLQPRLIDGNTGATPLLNRSGRSAWSGSESSLNSEADPPARVGDRALSSTNSYRQSLSSCTLDPDSFTFASVTSSGTTLTLPDLGVSLTIPEGALDKGFTEEVFLAVMTEGRDRPRLSDNQTLLSPVVLTGPPRLTFKKPVVLTFGHCALAQNSWEMGVYHCDSLFSDADDTPWVKLTTVGNVQRDSQVLAHIENDSCHVMTDYLSRFCLVGQSVNQLGAVKALYLLIFGKPRTSSSLDFVVSVQVADRTPSALEMALRIAERQGYGLLEAPHIFNYYDYGSGSDLHVILSDCVAGWALRSSNDCALTFHHVWASGQIQIANYTLEHVDPSVQIIAFKVSLQQVHSALNEVFNIQVDTKARLVNPLDSKKRWKIQNGILTTSSGSTNSSSTTDNVFKLPSGLKLRLCRMLDQVPSQAGLNDWKALAATLRLESGYFQQRSSPTECILTLWEVQQQNNNSQVNPIVDLLNLLRVIGRQDAAQMVEKDFGPWI